MKIEIWAGGNFSYFRGSFLNSGEVGTPNISPPMPWAPDSLELRQDEAFWGHRFLLAQGP